MKIIDNNACKAVSGATQYLLINVKATVQGIPKEFFEKILGQNTSLNMTLDEFYDKARADMIQSSTLPMPRRFSTEIETSIIDLKLVDE
jgi:hypothetical protein